MNKAFKRILLIVALIIIAGLVLLFTYVPPLSERHGSLETKLFLGEGNHQPMVVAFGGGGGGNDWSRDYMKSKRDSLKKKGYAFLAIGYFNAEGLPDYLDRISLDAIADTILSFANHPKINTLKIALMGGSRGGELALNLGSRFHQFNAVIALSTSNVSFPAITWSANTSSWTYKGEEVAYVPAPLKTIGPAFRGDLFTAHSMMLEDEAAVSHAEIPVEQINGPILIMSGENDEQWPATSMSNRIMERLKEHNFNHYNEHVVIDGGHIAPLDQFDLVIDFLERHMPVE